MKTGRSLIAIALWAAACASNQQALPTIAVLPSPVVAATATFDAVTATIATAAATLTPTATVRPTDDIEAMVATGEAAIETIRQPLEQFPDFQGLRLLSGLMLDDGLSINIDANVAPADDNEFTMARVLELAQQNIALISQIRVNTFNNDQPSSLWLWENDQWTVTRLASSRSFQGPLIMPENCATAVAAGLTAEQAAQWEHLDRDGDGVACHGD